MLPTMIFFLALIASIYGLFKLLQAIVFFKQSNYTRYKPSEAFTISIIASILWSYLFYLLH